MRSNKKTDGIDRQRVVLNLTTEQAGELFGLLKSETNETARKICIRLQKTLTKQRILRKFIEQGIENPTPAQMQGAMSVVMDAAQEVIDDRQDREDDEAEEQDMLDREEEERQEVTK